MRKDASEFSEQKSKECTCRVANELERERREHKHLRVAHDELIAVAVQGVERAEASKQELVALQRRARQAHAAQCV